MWVAETLPYIATNFVDGRATNTTALINVSQPSSVMMTVSAPVTLRRRHNLMTPSN